MNLRLQTALLHPPLHCIESGCTIILFTIQRIVEPELMVDKAQVKAYAAADFEQAHCLIVETFELYFPNVELEGDVLDLGCGSGDISFRFADRFAKCVLFGLDGSPEMIKLANERKDREPALANRITFTQGIIPGAPILKNSYSAIISNSLLHHLHRPEVLWETLVQCSTPGTKFFITDLFRPQSKQDAQRIVNEYSADEPEVLRRDFYNSLLAAFTVQEIEQQLADANLLDLNVKQISDRHVAIFGEKN